MFRSISYHLETILKIKNLPQLEQLDINLPVDLKASNLESLPVSIFVSDDILENYELKNHKNENIDPNFFSESSSAFKFKNNLYLQNRGETYVFLSTGKTYEGTWVASNLLTTRPRLIQAENKLFAQTDNLFGEVDAETLEFKDKLPIVFSPCLNNI